MEEYNEDENASQALPSFDNLHFPAALIAVAFAIFLFSQISNLGQNGRSMRWQSENLDRQIAGLINNEKGLDQLLKQRESLVQQSQQIQGRYTEMFNELIILAATDPDARAVVEKYRIQRQQPAPAPQLPSADASQKPTH